MDEAGQERDGGDYYYDYDGDGCDNVTDNGWLQLLKVLVYHSTWLRSGKQTRTKIISYLGYFLSAIGNWLKKRRKTRQTPLYICTPNLILHAKKEMFLQLRSIWTYLIQTRHTIKTIKQLITNIAFRLQMHYCNGRQQSALTHQAVFVMNCMSH